MTATGPIAVLIAIATLGLSTVPRVRLFARRILHRAMRLCLRLRSRPYPVEQDNAILVIAPHQDDETLGCGGLLTLKRIEGASVRVVYVTDGSASHVGHPQINPADLSARRTGEARRAMSIIGVEQSSLTFLNMPDGTLAHLSAAASETIISRLADFITSVRPAEILLPCRRDGSSEHDATFQLVQLALARSRHRPRLLEFPVWSWWNPLLLVPRLFSARRVWRADFRGYESIKRQALAAYTSQTETQPPWSQALLSRAFLSFFSSNEEYFFES